MIDELQERLTTIKKKIPRHKTPKQKKAIADDLHSLHTRLRDSFDGMYGKCITCDSIKLVKDMDNGHFMSRSRIATRWQENNTHLQCKGCNGFGGGKQYLHGVAIDKKYGVGTAEEIELQSRQIVKVKVKVEEAISYYMDKLDNYEVPENDFVQPTIEVKVYNDMEIAHSIIDDELEEEEQHFEGCDCKYCYNGYNG